MTPFLSLRLWLRRSPLGERLAVAGIGTALLALLAWAAVPIADPSSSALTSDQAGPTTGGQQPTLGGTTGATATPVPGTTTGGAVASGTGGTTGTTTGGTGRSGTASSGGTTGSTGTGGSTGTTENPCGTAGSTDQGVTATEVRIDVTLADLQGSAGNGVVGIPSADEQRVMFQAAIDHANASGGIRCRKITVVNWYKVNPLDQTSAPQVCANIVSDKVFALLDEGLGSPVGSSAPRDCPPQNKIPSFGSLSISQGELDDFAPYLFGYFPPAERTVHDSILGAHQLGWFGSTAKVGLLMQECIPSLNDVAFADLKAIGYARSSITTFDFGCPNAIPAPSDVENAVLTFQRAGVTHVLDDGGVYENYFSKVAAKQQYHPRYMVGDQGTIALWNNPTFGPDPQNFDGGLAITGTRYGEEHTSGMMPNAATKKCDVAMAKAGQPSSWASPDGFSGVVCDLVQMLVLGANHAPSLKRELIAKGLASLGTIDMPYPAGPASFGAHKGQVGGGSWRTAVYHAECSCFRVARQSFTKDFP